MENCEFNVKFWGIRGSYPTPQAKFLEYGGNTTCVEVNVGTHKINLDAGTGIINLGEEMIKEHLTTGTNIYDRTPMNATILFSHIHQDHLQGFPFFKPAHIKTSSLNILGYSDYENGLAETLSDLLFGRSFPLDLGDIAAKLNIFDLAENEVIILEPNKTTPIIITIENEEDTIPTGENVVISAYKTYAHPKNGNVIYKIAYKDKSIVFASDKESYIGGDKKLALFARDCDLLIHDAQYTNEDYSSSAVPKQGFGHSTFDMAVEMKQLSHAKKLVFFHLDPTYDDNVVNSIENHYKQKCKDCIMAKEGLEISIL